MKEAVSLTHELLQSGQHPYPAVSRFLVSKLSRNGEASLLVGAPLISLESKDSMALLCGF